MKFPEFLTYCELKDLFAVDMTSIEGRMVSIKTPHDDVGLYLLIDMADVPTIVKGQFYKYSAHQIDYELNRMITMPTIEKTFFPE